MRNTFLTILVLCLVVSCQKADPPPSVSFGATYAKSGVTPPSAIQVFAHSGEITDAATRERINAIDSFYAVYGSVNLAKNPQGFLDSLVFETQSSAVISAYSRKTNYSVTQENGAFILTSKDTLTGFISGTEMSRNIQYMVPTPRRELYSEYLAGVSQGTYYFNYRFRDKLMVRSGTGQDLAIPILMYSWYRSGNIYAREFIAGALNKSFYPNIASGDTVAIREYEFHYTK
jgi:hypothetical protein